MSSVYIYISIYNLGYLLIGIIPQNMYVYVHLNLEYDRFRVGVVQVEVRVYNFVSTLE